MLDVLRGGETTITIKGKDFCKKSYKIGEMMGGSSPGVGVGVLALKARGMQ